MPSSGAGGRAGRPRWEWGKGRSGPLPFLLLQWGWGTSASRPTVPLALPDRHTLCDQEGSGAAPEQFLFSC